MLEEGGQEVIKAVTVIITLLLLLRHVRIITSLCSSSTSTST
jgi:hypothetical protein